VRGCHGRSRVSGCGFSWPARENAGSNRQDSSIRFGASGAKPGGVGRRGGKDDVEAKNRYLPGTGPAGGVGLWGEQKSPQDYCCSPRLMRACAFLIGVSAANRGVFALCSNRNNGLRLHRHVAIVEGMTHSSSLPVHFSTSLFSETDLAKGTTRVAGPVERGRPRVLRVCWVVGGSSRWEFRGYRGVVAISNEIARGGWPPY